MRRKIILLGGMPTAGKTTIARQVSKHFDIPYISTDQIRTIMESVADPKVFPMLFSSGTYSAEEYLEKYLAEDIADMEFKQGYEVWKGIKYFIEKDWVWRDGCVIEGVGIIPSLVSSLDKVKFDVSAVFVSDTNHDRLKHVIYNRGLFDNASNYSDHVKDKEVEWVKLFDEKIRQDAKKSGYPIIELKKDESDITQVLSSIST